MKKVLFIGLTFISLVSTAQVGIGTTTPDASAKLQIDATDKGFLPPRVALTSLTDQSTISAPAEGLLVYCTGTAGLDEGYYYWEGASWVKMSNTANSLDMGYVVGWPSNATPPGFMLPLTGGTYNWADYPEFQTFNSTYASQFIASSNATTFTLKNINTAGRFLRGGTTAGTDQDDATSLPNTAFTAAIGGSHTHSVDPAAVNTTSAGAHVHSIDPPSTSSSTDGLHSHTYQDAYFAENRGISGNNKYGLSAGSDYDNNFIWRTSSDSYSNYASDINTSSNGSHAHTTDIAAFNSASNGDHAHSVDIPSTTSTSNGDHTHTITGGDAETRPINTSIVWCLKVKPTATSGNLTINNNTNAVSTASNGLTAASNNVKLGGSLSETTTINKNGNNLVLSGSGNVVITGDVTATGTIRSAAPGQVLNVAMLPPNATGDVSVGTTTFSNVAQVSYTPVSNNSYILVEYITVYTIAGNNTDDFSSEINIGGTQIAYGYQLFTNALGASTRSGVLFPLMGRYTNSSTSALTINVNVKRNTSDDNIVVKRDNSSWFKITEIAR